MSYKKIFDYLMRQDNDLPRSDGAIAFCRADPLIAKKAKELFDKGLIDFIIFTGGIGKDSGPLIDINLPESIYQAALLRYKHNVSDEKIIVEPNAMNGIENSKLSLEKINTLPHENVILIIHPLQLLRIQEVHKKIAQEMGINAKFYATPTDYVPDPNNEKDQREAIREILKIDSLDMIDEPVPKQFLDFAVSENKRLNLDFHDLSKENIMKKKFNI
jgi:uncharacterized SAM-binding protein YcdF (DUF218 family)